jgi:GYF domain 2
MATQWYYARDGAKFGPFSVAQLKELAVTRQLRPQDTVWKEGVERGVLAAKVKDLFSASRTNPPPTVGGGPAAPAPPTPVPPSLTPAADSAVPLSPPPAPMTPLAVRLAMPEGLELAPGEAVWEPPVSTAPDDAAGPDPAEGEGEERSAAAGSRSGKKPLPEGQQAGQQQQQARKRRVLGVKGGVIQSQDGLVLRYRKKCLRCGYADTSLATMAIRSGVTRGNFFCPKCRKSQQVEVQAVTVN